MVPGWRVMTFRALHFGQAAELSMDRIRKPRAATPNGIPSPAPSGTSIAVHEMSFSTEAQRETVEPRARP